MKDWYAKHLHLAGLALVLTVACTGAHSQNDKDWNAATLLRDDAQVRRLLSKAAELARWSTTDHPVSFQYLDDGPGSLCAVPQRIAFVEMRGKTAEITMCRQALDEAARLITAMAILRTGGGTKEREANRLSLLLSIEVPRMIERFEARRAVRPVPGRCEPSLLAYAIVYRLDSCNSLKPHEAESPMLSWLVRDQPSPSSYAEWADLVRDLVMMSLLTHLFLHELGHVAAGDLRPGAVWSPEQEANADAFAVRALKDEWLGIGVSAISPMLAVLSSTVTAAWTNRLAGQDSTDKRITITSHAMLCQLLRIGTEENNPKKIADARRRLDRNGFNCGD